MNPCRGNHEPQRVLFYWELHEDKPSQAVRFGNWKAVKNGPKAAIEPYDRTAAPPRPKDLAGDKPELDAQARRLLAESSKVDPLGRPTRIRAKRIPGRPADSLTESPACRSQHGPASTDENPSFTPKSDAEQPIA